MPQSVLQIAREDRRGSQRIERAFRNRRKRASPHDRGHDRHISGDRHVVRHRGGGLRREEAALHERRVRPYAVEAGHQHRAAGHDLRLGAHRHRAAHADRSVAVPGTFRGEQPRHVRRGLRLHAAYAHPRRTSGRVPVHALLRQRRVHRVSGALGRLRPRRPRVRRRVQPALQLLRIHRGRVVSHPGHRRRREGSNHLAHLRHTGHAVMRGGRTSHARRHPLRANSGGCAEHARLHHHAGGAAHHRLVAGEPAGARPHRRPASSGPARCSVCS